MGWWDVVPIVFLSLSVVVNTLQIRRLQHALAEQRLSVLEKVVSDALEGKR